MTDGLPGDVPGRKDGPGPGDRGPWGGGGRWDGGPPWTGGPGWGGRRRRGRHAGGGGAGFLGCLLVLLVLFVGVVTALSTWLAAALLGIIAPGAAPSTTTAFAVVVVLVLASVILLRVIGSAVRPLADLAAASGRLADGEAGVRVPSRGPGPVRGLIASFNGMAERLDRSREERQALLADVTHELRTPLTVVSGGIEAMLDGVHPMDEDHMAPILAQVGVMDRLLDDLRTLSLAEAGALPLHREPVDLRTLADDVVAVHRPAAVAAGVELTVSGDTSVVISVDPLRVGEIIGNLVVNALRHTPAGGRVAVEVRATGADALLVVSDNGEGIPPAEINRVFDRFHHRADTGGSGLGLAIVRDLVAAHGGSVEAKSAGVPGHGSTFRVRLPLRH